MSEEKKAPERATLSWYVSRGPDKVTRLRMEPPHSESVIANDCMPIDYVRADIHEAVKTERDEAVRKRQAMSVELTEALATVERVRAQLRVVNAGHEAVWRWQGGGDEPSSLSCPVVMSAETLRGFVALEGEFTALRDAYRERGVMLDRAEALLRETVTRLTLYRNMCQCPGVACVLDCKECDETLGITNDARQFLESLREGRANRRLIREHGSCPVCGVVATNHPLIDGLVRDYCADHDPTLLKESTDAG